VITVRDVVRNKALAAGAGEWLRDLVLMREDPAELVTGDPYERARWLASRTGLDAPQIGLQPVGAQMLAAADHIAALP